MLYKYQCNQDMVRENFATNMTSGEFRDQVKIIKTEINFMSRIKKNWVKHMLPISCFQFFIQFKVIAVLCDNNFQSLKFWPFAKYIARSGNTVCFDNR